jgi:hypothetical protein
MAQATQGPISRLFMSTFGEGSQASDTIRAKTVGSHPTKIVSRSEAVERVACRTSEVPWAVSALSAARDMAERELFD